MELTTVVMLLLGLLIVLVLVFAVAKAGGTNAYKRSHNQSSDRYIQELHRQGDVGKRQIDIISKDYLRKVQETLRR